MLKGEWLFSDEYKDLFAIFVEELSEEDWEAQSLQFVYNRVHWSHLVSCYLHS